MGTSERSEEQENHNCSIMQVCIILIKITSPICYTTLELSRNCSAVRSNRQAYTVYQVKSFPVIRCKSLPDGGLERTLGSYYKQNKWQKIAAVAQTAVALQKFHCVQKMRRCTFCADTSSKLYT